MTEEYWANQRGATNWKTKKDAAHPNILWKTIENQRRVEEDDQRLASFLMRQRFMLLESLILYSPQKFDTIL